MRYWFYYLTKWTLWVLFHLGFGLEVRGQRHVPRRGAFILASNHLSYLDPPLLGAACPRRLAFLARADLFRAPLLAAFMRGVHVIALQREATDIAAVREALARLRRGDAVAIFPEGGRQFSGQLGSAKRGVALLAFAADVPIVPVFVRGTFEAWPPGARRLRRAKIRVAFGPPIPYTATTPPPAGSPGSQIPQGRGEGAGAARHRQQAVAAAVTDAWRRLEQPSHGSD